MRKLVVASWLFVPWAAVHAQSVTFMTEEPRVVPGSPFDKFFWDYRISRWSFPQRVTTSSAAIISKAALNMPGRDCQPPKGEGPVYWHSRMNSIDSAILARFAECAHGRTVGDRQVVRVNSFSDIPNTYDASNSMRLSIELEALPAEGLVDLSSPGVYTFYTSCSVWGCTLGIVTAGTLEVVSAHGKADRVRLNLRIGPGPWQDSSERENPIQIKTQFVVDDIHECQRAAGPSNECA